MSAPALSVRGLTVDCTGLPVVGDISFDVSAGRTLGLVGASGSGKSTVAAAVAGVLEAPMRMTGGTILRTAGAVGILFQDAGATLDPMYRVGAQIAETVSMRDGCGAAEATRRVESLLLDAGLSDAADIARRHPHRLSGGQRQRAALALVLAARPAILVADEPTSALDAVSQAAFVRTLRHLATGRGLTTLLISHDLGVIAAASDDVAVMQDGALVETGTVAAVMTAPVHPYTRRLLAAVPAFVRKEAA